MRIPRRHPGLGAAVLVVLVVSVAASWLVVGFARVDRHGRGVASPGGRLVARWERAADALPPSGYDARSATVLYQSAAEHRAGPGPTLMAVDARTGAARWETRTAAGTWLTEAMRRVPLVTPSGVGFVQRERDLRPEAITAVRIADGRRLWESGPLRRAGMYTDRLIGLTVPPAPFASPRSVSVRAVAVDTGGTAWQEPVPAGCDDPTVFADTRVVALVGCAGTVHARRPADGSLLWSWSAPAGCAGRHAAASDAVLAVVVTCGPRSAAVVTLDPGTGTQLGRAPVPWRPENADPGDPDVNAPHVEVADDIVVVHNEDAVLMLAPSGERRWESPGTICGYRCIVRTPSVAVVSVRPAGSREEANGTLVGVDLRTDRVRWSVPGLPEEMLVHNGLIYATGAFPGPFHITEIMVVQPGTGRRQVARIPRQGIGLLGVDGADVIVDYTVHHGSHDDSEVRVAAYRFDRTGLDHFAGGDPDRWPDACQLVTTDDIQRLRPGSRYRPVPRPVTVTGVPAPMPVGCSLLPDDVRRPVVGVAVLWMSTSHAEARAYAAQRVGRGMPEAIAGTVGPSFAYDASTDLDVPDRRAVVVGGGCILEITAPGDEQLARLLAPVAAGRLTGPAASGPCSA